MSRPSATSRCCCNFCSGTTPCSRRCRTCATACAIPGGACLNNRGLFLPEPKFQTGFGYVELAIAGRDRRLNRAIIAGRASVGRKTGEQAPVFLVSLGLIVGLPLLVVSLPPACR